MRLEPYSRGSTSPSAAKEPAARRQSPVEFPDAKFKVVPSDSGQLLPEAGWPLCYWQPLATWRLGTSLIADGRPLIAYLLAHGTAPTSRSQSRNRREQGGERHRRHSHGAADVFRQGNVRARQGGSAQRREHDGARVDERCADGGAGGASGTGGADGGARGGRREKGRRPASRPDRSRVPATECRQPRDRRLPGESAGLERLMAA